MVENLGSRSIRVCYTNKQVMAFLADKMPHVDWAVLNDKLPPIIWRSRWEAFGAEFGLPYSRKYLQNLDSQGCGPSAY